MNRRFKEIFAGKVANKRLTFNTGMDEFPCYALEHLIDNSSWEETFDGGFKRVTRSRRRTSPTAPRPRASATPSE